MEASNGVTSPNENRLAELEIEVKSFGQKRAYFMDIYKKKEEETNKLTEELENLKHCKSRLESELKGIREQVADMKTEHMITCLSKDEEMDRLKEVHQEDLSSLNMSLQELLNENSKKHELEEKVGKLVTVNKNLNEELKIVKTSLQGRLQMEENMRRGLSTSAQKSTLDSSRGTPSSCPASCIAEKNELRTQVDDLRTQLDAAHQILQKYADQQTLDDADEEADSLDAAGEKKSKDLFEVVDHEEKLKELENELKAEKASRRDLEMYVAVLAKQKDVFQTDVEELRRELRESLDLLEKEGKEHENLKLTWQMANDQFLESQRLLMIDMKRMESVLTEEQQRKVEELQRQDAEKEAHQQEMEELEKHKQEQIDLIEAEGDSLLNLPGSLKNSSSHTSLSSAEVYREFENAEPLHLETSNKESSGEQADLMHRDTPDSMSLPSSLNISRVILTDDMTSALVAPQAEDMENSRVLGQFRQQTPDRISSTTAAGSRVVSEKQWAKLQEELQQSRAKLGRPCDMCKNYEAELQKEQEQIKSLEGQLNQSRQNVKEQKKVISELEENMKSLGLESTSQLTRLNKMVEELEEKVYVLTATLDETSQEFRARVLSLVKEREDVQKQLLELESENEKLLDMHSSTSQEMLEQQFVLPADLSSAHKLLTELREKLISCKAAKQHTEGKLTQQVSLLKDQAIAEELEWRGKEEALTQELSRLTEINVRLKSVQSELERESKQRQALEDRLQQAEINNQGLSKSEEKLESQLRLQISELNSAKTENQALANKLRTLQAELTNSESVQKDFVKLSQQLQVQLEKIRQAETEVRWEYEADVSQCNSCNVEFSSNRDKHHCMHCGKIHCQECTSKLVNAGPNARPTRVCDVCHTILESDATPYFSSNFNQAS
ncbi:rab GTPase-binding effector protein 1-like [Watersipora subatra]|uniref:rab GTPase-binding effector protein 1-like n=1 Tax=Watersipora subatra TaxID=2589382 RepID=UPI00355C1AD9